MTLALLALPFALVAQAPATISGIIRDARENPIAGANDAADRRRSLGDEGEREIGRAHV